MRMTRVAAPGYSLVDGEHHTLHSGLLRRERSKHRDPESTKALARHAVCYVQCALGRKLSRDASRAFERQLEFVAGARSADWRARARKPHRQRVARVLRRPCGRMAKGTIQRTTVLALRHHGAVVSASRCRRAKAHRGHGVFGPRLSRAGCWRARHGATCAGAGLLSWPWPRRALRKQS